MSRRDLLSTQKASESSRLLEDTLQSRCVSPWLSLSTTKNWLLSQGCTDSIKAQRESSIELEWLYLYNKNYNCQVD